MEKLFSMLEEFNFNAYKNEPMSKSLGINTGVKNHKVSEPLDI